MILTEMRNELATDHEHVRPNIQILGSVDDALESRSMEHLTLQVEACRKESTLTFAYVRLVVIMPRSSA